MAILYFLPGATVFMVAYVTFSAAALEGERVGPDPGLLRYRSL